jgi:ABC-type branched-subunit amino acid transport system ATPase component
VLSAADISVHYGGVYAVKKVSLDLKEGEVLGIVGPNGSGKSTLLNAISGLTRATGSLRIDGSRIPLNRPRAPRRAGFLRTFQTPQVFTELTCIENVLLSASNRRGDGLLGSFLMRPWMWRAEHARVENAKAALDRVGLGHLAARSALGLAYGQNRHLEIARAIAARPTYLAMDEPSAGLNLSETQRLATLIRSIAADGVTILVVDHKIDFLRGICDRMLVLQLGEVIADGTPDEVFSNPAVVDAYLGV